MKKQLIPPFLLLAATSTARPLEKRAIEWGPCLDIAVESALTYECGTLSVPLDYAAPTDGSFELQLTRILAVQQPSNGSIQFNFGGPGLEARNSLVSFGERLQVATGGIYDLVAFDPRGTANTMPFNCSQNELDLYSLSTNSVLGNSSDVALGQSWAFSHKIRAQCNAFSGDIGEYLGTAAVSRDLISVVDALDEDGKLRFWGFSYGSELGATVAAMFPDRIDKIIIDAVANVHEYYDAYGIVEQWSDSDKAFSGMWSTCLDAGPELCSLATIYNDASDLENDVWDLIFSLKQFPQAVGSNHSLIIDYTAIKGLMASSLYSTLTWPTTANITRKLLQAEFDDELYGLWASLRPVTPLDNLPDALTGAANFGIQCSDRRAKTDRLENLLPALEDAERISRLMGDVTYITTMTCSTWDMPAKEIYNGGWENIATQNPMLLIGNTYDGHTALRSAHNMSASFVDSVVLQIDGYGHGSTNLISQCASRATAAYFVNGTMPEEGAICPIDLLPYHVENQ